MFKLFPLLLTALFMLISGGAGAGGLTGAAEARDGRTLIINGTPVELYGIDSLERDQTCLTKRNKEFPCGQVATTALATLIHHVVVDCRPEGPDLPVQKAICRAGPMDIAEQQVIQGWAFADPETGNRYRRAERAARVLNEGIWKGRFDFPWDWRKQHR